MHFPRFPLRGALAASLVLLTVPCTWAQEAEPEPSSITSVLLYPGSATVERSLRVRPGAKDARFACLPADLDAAQVQATGSDGVQVGEISVQRQTRKLLGSLCRSPQQARIDELEAQLAGQRAELDAIDYATDFLQSVGKGDARSAPRSPEQIAAAAATLRDSGRELLVERQTLVRKHERLSDELEQLKAERDRAGGDDAEVSVVRVTLYAPMGGQVALRYQVQGPSWQPAYRAELDTESQKLKLTRLAKVAQSTGEDWSDVEMTLSTGQPAAATEGPLPRPWRIDLAGDVQERRVLRKSAAPVMAEMADASAAGAAPRFEPAVFEGTFATEFKVSQPVAVPTGGDSITLKLDDKTLPAQWLVRATPALDSHAYLIARPEQAPEGVWPAGEVALYRDAAFVGRGRLDLQQLARAGLAFGRDELVRVRSEQPEHSQGSKGLIGSRNERVDERVYRVENGHDRAVELELLDAAPVPQNDKIKVASEYSPQVQEGDWQERRGTVYWQQTLDAGARQTFKATHTISWPKDERLSERPW